MRLIKQFRNEKDAQVISTFLNMRDIPNVLEPIKVTDWGDSDYGTIRYLLWIKEEDDIEAAYKWLDEFDKNPDHPMFTQNVKRQTSPDKQEEHKPRPQSKLKYIKVSPGASVIRHPIGIVTFYLLILCILIFTYTQITAPPFEVTPKGISAVPLLSSSLKKTLMYDYPETYEIIDQIVKLYGVDGLQNPTTLPPEGKYLLQTYYITPYWQGLYDLVLGMAKQNPQIAEVPLFEKIQEGEIWRLFTPCLLHLDIIHLLFNMAWLLILGKQIEQRTGSWRYLLFVLAVGIVSNTAQYLMSGPNFIGFSGVAAGMIAFVWVRQKIAPWEGYQLHPLTFKFIMIFIFGIFILQVAFFIMEIITQTSLSLGIANTAHLVGLLFGGILARMSLFSWNR